MWNCDKSPGDMEAMPAPGTLFNAQGSAQTSLLKSRWIPRLSWLTPEGPGDPVPALTWGDVQAPGRAGQEQEGGDGGPNLRKLPPACAEPLPLPAELEQLAERMEVKFQLISDFWVAALH